MHHLRDRRTGGGFKPFMQFRMAIREGEGIGVVMVTARQIPAPSDRRRRVNDQPAIVYTIRVLVREHPKVHGRRIPDV